MKDVAREAGVSQAAVSYAYNRPAKLSEGQVKHILRIAAKLKYPGPNIVGRSLRSGSTGAIGVMVMDTLAYAFSDPSTKALLEGITQGRRQSELALTLLPLPRDTVGIGRDGKPVLSGENPALRGLVDGLVLHSLPDAHPAVLHLRDRQIPMVVVDAPLLKNVPLVTIEDRQAASAQMSHLLELGHRRIGVIAERLRPDGYRGMVSAKRRSEGNERVVRERLEGYRQACKAADLTFDKVPIVEAGGFTREDGVTATKLLLDSHDVTGIVTTSDTMALAVLDVARSRRIGVPRDLSIIGFDDAPEAERAGLTTIHQPLVEKGRIASDMLSDLLAGATDVKSVILPTHLVVRRTTAAPPRVP